MFKRFPFLAAGLLTGRVLAQSAFSNDSDPTRWINYQQTYLKIPVAQAGLYRITAAELTRAGVSLSAVNPTTVQVFHRGVEQAIVVEGEADGRFDATDFVEFYGQGNDGAPDSLLYRPVSAQPHAHYSLFSDTTAYFLTWQLDRSRAGVPVGAGKPGRRMAAYTDTADAGLTPEAYHWAEELRLFTDTYPGYAAGIPPKIEYSHYEAGEGYTGVVQHKDKPYDNPFTLTNAVRTGPAPQIKVLLVGRDYTMHRVECRVGASADARRLLDSTLFSTYENARLQHDLTWTDVGSDGRLLVSTVSRGNGSDVDRYSVSLIQLRYPQALTANDQPQRRFRLAANPAGQSLLMLTQVPAETRFYDITDPNAPVRVGAAAPAVGLARLVVRGTDVPRTLLSTSQPQSVAALQPVTFPNWSARKPTYLIVSHEALMQPVSPPTPGNETNAVRAYAAYRASAAGGGHDTLTATMEQLVNQFSYGERHPLAIRRFAAQMLRQAPVAYLLLLGRARSTPGVRRDPKQAALDLVMTYGFPGSDGLFTAGLDNVKLDNQLVDVPAIPTGRVNAGTPQEVLAYLGKVMEYESPLAGTLWRKNVLHLSGGQTAGEARLFRGLVDAYRDQAVVPSLGARVATLSKETDNPVERIDVVKPVNDGVGLMTFFGHSGLDVTDLDIGFCSNDALGYRNRGKYPMLLINGCAIGNFFFGRPTLTTDWVLTPGRGAIAAIAQSHLGYVGNLHEYSTHFYNLLTDSLQLIRSIGQLQQETIRRVLAQTPGGLSLANAQQMVLQGDPALRLFPFETPDYVLTAGGLRVEGLRIGGPINQPLTTLSDSVVIRAVVENAGQYRRGPLPVRVRRWVAGRESGVYNLTLPHTVAYRDTLTLTLPNERDADGPNQFEVTINPTNATGASALPEANRANNRAVAEINVAGQKPVLVYPAPGSLVRATTIRLTAEYRTDTLRRFDLELDSTARFDSPGHPTQRLTTMGVISYVATLPARRNVTYYWRVRRADLSNDLTAWSVGQFVYAPNSPAVGLPEGQIRLPVPLPTDIRQGDTLAIPVQFTNLSPYPFADSLLVRQTIYAAGLSQPQSRQWRLPAPTVGDTLRFTTRLPTANLPGVNRVMITVNPRLQPEHSYHNNTLDVSLPSRPIALARCSK